MSFNYIHNGGYVGRDWDNKLTGVHGLTYSNHALTYAAGIFKSTEEINAAVSSYNYSNHASIRGELETLGFSVIMIPSYGGVAESMAGVSSASSMQLKKFNYTYFQSNDYIELSSGFDNELLNDYAYYGFCGFNGSTFYGTCIVMYTGYTGDTYLRDLWYPNVDRPYRAFVRHADDSTNEYTGTQSTIFSDNQQPGIYGYRSTARFAQDDGCFGFKETYDRLDGNGGGYHWQNLSTQASYGCENPNSGDTSANDFFWKNSVSVSTQYAFYAFVKFRES